MKLTAQFWVKFRAGVKEREGFNYRYPFPVLAMEGEGDQMLKVVLADRHGKLTSIPGDEVRLVTKKTQ